MSTPNLAIPHILQSQAQKEVTANAAFDALDQAIAGLLAVYVSAGGTITVDPAAALTCKMLRLTGTLAAGASASRSRRPASPAAPKRSAGSCRQAAIR